MRQLETQYSIWEDRSFGHKTLFLEPFSQIFEQLFVNGEAFLKKLF